MTLVSGHSASGEDLDFDQLAAAPGTLVVFMGLAHLAEIADGLVAAGKDPRTPAAVVSRGTHPDGRSVGGELHEIAASPQRSSRLRSWWSATWSRWAGSSPPEPPPRRSVLAVTTEPRIEARGVRRLVRGDPFLALQRQRDVVEAVHEHVPRERVELERIRRPDGCVISSVSRSTVSSFSADDCVLDLRELVLASSIGASPS